jgi:hypothetical protein
MKVKSLLFLLLAFLFTGSFVYGQRGLFGTGFKILTGSGDLKTEGRNVTGFTKVETDGSINVFITKADAFEVKVESDDNLIPYIVTEVKGNTLVVRMKDNINIRKAKKMTVYASMPRLVALTTRGSGSITSESKFNGEDFVAKTQGSGSIRFFFDGKSAVISTQGSGGIKFSGSINKIELGTHGSGSIKAELVSESAHLYVGGSGSLSIQGTANDVIAEVQGSGSIDGYNFQSKHANASVQGSGSCNLSVSDNLIGKIQGSGNINYKGDATVVTSESNGSGKIRKQ